MINSTKTWQEEFDNIDFYSAPLNLEKAEGISKDGLVYKLKRENIKQLITDLRKKDEQQLLLKLSLETRYYGREIEMKISKIIE